MRYRSSWWGRGKLGQLYQLLSRYESRWWCPPTTQGRVASSPWIPPHSCIFHLLTSMVAQRRALFYPAAPFQRDPSKIPDIPAISGAMFIWQKEGLRWVGRRGGAKKKDLTHKQFGLHWRVNMCWRVCAWRGAENWGSCVLVLTHRSHLSRDSAVLCSGPNGNNLINSLLCSMDSALCWRTWNTTKNKQTAKCKQNRTKKMSRIYCLSKTYSHIRSLSFIFQMYS